MSRRCSEARLRRGILAQVVDAPSGSRFTARPLDKAGFHPDDSTQNSSRLVSQASLCGGTTMRLESRTFVKVTAVAMLVLTLVILDFVLTGGEILAYGRHGSS
jgi:hypothetical protein